MSALPPTRTFVSAWSMSALCHKQTCRSPRRSCEIARVYCPRKVKGQTYFRVGSAPPRIREAQAAVLCGARSSTSENVPTRPETKEEKNCAGLVQARLDDDIALSDAPSVSPLVPEARSSPIRASTGAPSRLSLVGNITKERAPEAAANRAQAHRACVHLAVQQPDIELHRTFVSALSMSALSSRR
jgi:hypothetical protein